MSSRFFFDQRCFLGYTHTHTHTQTHTSCGAVVPVFQELCEDAGGTDSGRPWVSKQEGGKWKKRGERRLDAKRRRWCGDREERKRIRIGMK